MAQEASAARNAAQAEAARALHQTREAANDDLRRMRAEVQGQIETARRTLGAQAEVLAEEMVGAVTKGGRACSSSPSSSLPPRPWRPRVRITMRTASLGRS
jgi:hypothetical protein